MPLLSPNFKRTFNTIDIIVSLKFDKNKIKMNQNKDLFQNMSIYIYIMILMILAFKKILISNIIIFLKLNKEE